MNREEHVRPNWIFWATGKPIDALASKRSGSPATPVAGAGGRLFDDGEQLAPVVEVVDEVDLRGVDHQERPFVVGEEELGVGARELLDILRADRTVPAST